jgi:hypothetical protein
MATSRPFAYNTGSTLPFTEQVGDIAIGTGGVEYAANYGGFKWWGGPDEDLGYVITHTVPAGNQPNPLNIPAYIGFWRSPLKTEISFVNYTNFIFGTSFTTGDECKTYLNNNGYWTSYSGGPITSNLILYYDPSNSSSYPGTGTTINDLSGNGLNGSMSNITFTSPYFTYNGSSSQISVPDNALLEPGSGDWTIEFWVRHSVIAGASRILIAKTDGGLSADWGYGLRTVNNTNTFMEVGNGGSTSVNSPVTGLSINTWYQVVGVWTNVASNSIALYINGSLIGSNSHSFTSIKNTTSPLYLGSFNGGQFSQWLNGRMGVVRMYNKALTGSEVLLNFNADKSKYGL